MKASELDRRLKDLTTERDKRRADFISTSDHTRDVAGSIQQGMYYGQIALGLFRNLTNYHLPPKKRVKKVLITIAVLVAANIIRKKMVKKS
jgi:hypothetical protein